MGIQAVILAKRTVPAPAAPDLWAEINRTREVALKIKAKLGALADAIKASPLDHEAVTQAEETLRRVLREDRIAALCDQISSVPAAEDGRAQVHDPELWKLRGGLLEADAALNRVLGGADTSARLGAIDQARGELQEAAETALDITAADEAEDALEGRRVGSVVAMADLFPELKGNLEWQKRLAARLKVRAPRLFVDDERGYLYVESRTLMARIATYLAPLLWAALGAAVVLAPHWLGLRLDAKQDFWSGWRDPLGAYALVLGGVVLHLLVAAQKEIQSKSGAPLPLGNPLDWLNTRWASIALTFVWAVVVVFGLAITEPSGAKLDGNGAWLFVFAGFSVDSVAGLFLARFDVAAAKGTETVKERVAAASKTAVTAQVSK